ncbi:MAG TPA: aldo/keto reductase [Rhodopirellula sp.]|nr:aldo/keto reductase [Rhodopirellula sp.]
MEETMLPRVILGRTGLRVSCLGYGSMGIRGPKTWGVRTVNDEHAEKILNAILDMGINFIDTSPDYGLSETRIGRFLSSRRDEYYLATKCGCVYTQHKDHLEIDHQWRKEVIERNLHESLQRLQTDHIDLLQFHGGDAETLEREGLLSQLQDFRSQGLIHHIGVSSKIPNLAGLIDLNFFDTFQIPYSCLSPEHGDLITRAGESGAGIIIRGGIAHGGPDAEIQRPVLNDLWHEAKLDELIPKGMTRAELILRYTLSHPYCHTTIVGTCDPQHLAENVTASRLGQLPEPIYREISARTQRESE